MRMLRLAVVAFCLALVLAVAGDRSVEAQVWDCRTYSFCNSYCSAPWETEVEEEWLWTVCYIEGETPRVLVDPTGYCCGGWIW